MLAGSAVPIVITPDAPWVACEPDVGMPVEPTKGVVDVTLVYVSPVVLTPVWVTVEVVGVVEVEVFVTNFKIRVAVTPYPCAAPYTIKVVLVESCGVRKDTEPSPEALVVSWSIKNVAPLVWLTTWMPTVAFGTGPLVDNNLAVMVILSPGR